MAWPGTSVHASISPSSPCYQATSTPAKKSWPKTPQVVLSRQPPVPSRVPEMSCNPSWDTATLWYVTNVQRCNASSSSRPAIIPARQTLSPTMVVVVTNDDRATDTLPRLTFPTFQIQLSRALCLATKQGKVRTRLSFSASPHMSTQEPRSAFAHRELWDSESLFSTHVKLQLLPQFILMASCCAEEMLIATSPPFLDTVHLATRASARLLREFSGEGGLDGRRTSS